METATATALFLVQTSDYCWGKADTLEGALKECRNAGSRVTKTSKRIDYIVFEFDANVKPDTAYIDQMGTCRWEVESPDEAAGFKQGLVKEWIRQDGKNAPLTA